MKKQVDKLFETAGVQKKTNGACRQCQITKSRCTRERPICKRCSERKVDCQYIGVRRSAKQRASPSNLSDSFSPESHDSTRSVEPGPAYNPVSSDTGSEWLYHPSVPTSKVLLKRLSDAYFNRVHPLRCLGFIHKPTFMRSLDRGTLYEDYGEPLITIICALGARHVLEQSEDSTESTKSSTRIPGQQWAKRAKTLALENIGNPSPSTLMALLLVCEYGSLMVENAIIFTLVGCCYRLVRLMKLDAEATEESTTSAANLADQETRRRLLWACYVLDANVGSGVEANLCWQRPPAQVPMPQRDSDFTNQLKSQAVYIDANGDFHPNDLTALGLQAYAIRLMYLRTKVLKLIRLHNVHPVPWSEGSPFLELLEKLNRTYSNLPEQYALTELNVYIHKDEHTLGALHWLHFAHHAAVADLTRVSLAGFSFPLSSMFTKAPTIFKTQCQQRCYYHACQVSRLVKNALQLGNEALDDPFCAVATFESTKIQIIYTATVCPGDADIRARTDENIKANLSLLGRLRHRPEKANPFLLGLLPLLYRFGFHSIAAEWDTVPSSYSMEDGFEVTGSAKVDYLGAVTTFRLARSEIKNQGSPADHDSATVNAKIPSAAAPAIDRVTGSHTVTNTSRQPFILNENVESLGDPSAGHSTLPSGSFSSVNQTALLSGECNMLPPIEESQALETPVQEGTLVPGHLHPDYQRLADAMSDIITWDASYWPTWSYYDNSGQFTTDDETSGFDDVRE